MRKDRWKFLLQDSHRQGKKMIMKVKTFGSQKGFPTEEEEEGEGTKKELAVKPEFTVRLIDLF